MTSLHFLMDWEDAAIGAAFWTCLLWPLIVRSFWPWYRDQWGWNMIIKTEMIALALLAPILHLEFGIQPGLGLLWIGAVAITMIPVAVAWRTVIIYRDQRDGARERLAERKRQRERA